jgi:hypothetical protein
MHPLHNGFGLLHWAYNRDPAEDLTGTFALGSELDLPQPVLGRSIIPGEFMSAFRSPPFAIDVPEPDAVLKFARAARPGGAAVADGAPELIATQTRRERPSLFSALGASRLG